MSQSLYPVSREPHPPYRESGMTKVLAILLLVVAGALVFTVVQNRKQSEHYTSFEPRPISQRISHSRSCPSESGCRTKAASE